MSLHNSSNDINFDIEMASDSQKFNKNNRSLVDQQSSCYCGKDRNLNIAELLCASCNRWYHESCISYQLGKLVPFMTNYLFICKNCSPTGLETFKKNQASFPQMCLTAIANLKQENAKEGGDQILFSKDREIIPYIDQYWEAMTTMPRRVTQSWYATVQRALIKDIQVLFTYEEDAEDGPMFGLFNMDLTAIKPNYEAMIKQGQLKVTDMGVATVSDNESTEIVSNRKISVVWKYFRKTDEGDKTICNICGLTFCGSFTSNLMKHLKRMHGPEFSNLRSSEQLINISKTDEDVPTVNKIARHRNESKVWKYFRKTNGNETICSLCGKSFLRNPSNLMKHLKRIHEQEYSDLTGSAPVYKVLRTDESDTEPTVRTRKPRSHVWKFFTKNGKRVTCTICGKQLYKTASNLLRHLRRTHSEHDLKSESKINDSSEDESDTEPKVRTRKPRSHIWKFFTKNGKRVTCTICGKQLSKTASNLLRHLRRTHSEHDLKSESKINDSSEVVEKQPQPHNKRSIVWNYFEKVGNRVVCNICSKSFSPGTSNLLKHLRMAHRNTNDTVRITNATGRNTKSETVDKDTTSDDDPLSTANDVIYIREPLDKIISHQSPKPNVSLKLEYESIDNAFTRMIIKGFHPLSMGNEEEFVRFIKLLNPKYRIPSREKLAQTLIPGLYAEMTNSLLEMFQIVQYVSISINSWEHATSTKTFLCVTAHFIYNGDFQSSTLANKEIEAKHSDNNVPKILLDIFEQYNIFDKIVTIVADDTFKPNIAVLQKQHQPCITYLLNQSVNEALKLNHDLITLLLKVRDIVKFFKQGNFNELREQQSLMNLPVLKLKKERKQNWDCTLVMIERMLEVKETLILTLNNLSLSSMEAVPNGLSHTEWSALADCVPILKPCFEMTKELSSSKFVTLSYIIPLLRVVKLNIQNYPPVTSVGCQLKFSLLDMLSQNFGSLETTALAAKATFLDPRFKKAGFQEEQNANSTENGITAEIVGRLENNQLNTEVTEDDGNDDTTKTSSIWDEFDKEIAQENSLLSPTAAANLSLKQYIETKPLSRKEDPLIFWEENQNRFPELYNLAIKYLSIPATSISSDYMYTKAGQMLVERRNIMKSERLNEIIVLNGNL